MKLEVDCPRCLSVLVVTHGRVPRHNRVRMDGRRTRSPCPGSGALVAVVYVDKALKPLAPVIPLRSVR